MIKLFTCFRYINLNSWMDCHHLFKSSIGFKHHVTEKNCLNRRNICHQCGKHFSDKRNYTYHKLIMCAKKVQFKLKEKVDEQQMIDF